MKIHTTAWSFAESLSVPRQLHPCVIRTAERTEARRKNGLILHTLAKRVSHAKLSIAIVARLPARSFPQIGRGFLRRSRGIEGDDSAVPSAGALAKGRRRCRCQLQPLPIHQSYLLFARASENSDSKANSQIQDARLRMVVARLCPTRCRRSRWLPLPPLAHVPPPRYRPGFLV